MPTLFPQHSLVKDVHVPKTHSAKILLQDLQCSFFFPASLPHRKLDKGFLIFSQMVKGIWKQLMTYVGIDWATDFKRTYFPALDRGQSLHPLRCFQSRPVRKLKLLVGERPTRVCMPRYVDYNVSSCAPSFCFTLSLTLSSQFVPKNIDDF
jgi:hypothetical protein